MYFFFLISIFCDVCGDVLKLVLVKKLIQFQQRRKFIYFYFMETIVKYNFIMILVFLIIIFTATKGSVRKKM